MAMNLEFFVGKFTTTVTTGAIASSTAITVGLVDNFSARFALFDEFKIRSVHLRFYTLSTANQGVINVWIEPLSNATPTLALSKDNKTLTFSLSDSSRSHTLDYTIKDPNLTIWAPVTTTTAQVGYVKVYTDNAAYGATTVATDVLVVVGTMVVDFRGFA